MIKIAIASNKNFHHLTLPIIIKSLIDVDIKPEDIHVFIAGYDEYSFEIIDKIHYHKLNHNSYEYSPLIEIVEKEIQSEYWFLIHDTCRVGPRFKQLLYEIPSINPSKIALRSSPSMSIGLYNYQYLMSLKDIIVTIKNTDYSEESMMHWKRWGVPNEDWILWLHPPSPIVYGGYTACEVVNYENWYGTGINRRTEYYPVLDLYKNKSNWGQTGDQMVINL
jgi:hypothetical protein